MLPRILTAAIAICLTLASPAAAGYVEVRVAVELSAIRAELFSGKGLHLSSPESGAILNTGGAVDRAVFERNPHGIRVNGLLFPVRAVRVDSPEGIVGFNGNLYRGFFILYLNEKGTLDVVNHLDMEDYLKGVLPTEMPKDWPMEALKAQAVASRTYAYLKRSERSEGIYDLMGDINDQAYTGMARENIRTNEALSLTDGTILTYNGQLAYTYYHSTSGPMTENGWEVFAKGNVPYLKSVHCLAGRVSPHYGWRHMATYQQVQAALSRNGIRTGPIRGISIRSRTSTGRVKELAIHTSSGTRVVEAARFRLMMGSQLIKSTRFTMQKRGSRLVFTGVGYGHGVGMCQYGARAMADMDYSFDRILSHYYPGTTLRENMFASVK